MHKWGDDSWEIVGPCPSGTLHPIYAALGVNAGERISFKRDEAERKIQILVAWYKRTRQDTAA
jgi:hypothetical protein